MRRVLTILAFSFLIALQSQGQSAKTSATETTVPDRIIKLYPNPATTYINFDFQKDYAKGYSIQVYSFLGKKMYEGQNVASKVTLNLSEFNRGLYWYHLIDASGKVVESGKFQVTK